jgi:hypothetical protein
MSIQQLKVLKHLIFVCHGCVMQFEWFYSLNYSVVAWFAHLHHLGFQPTNPNLGNDCGGNRVNVHLYMPIPNS